MTKLNSDSIFVMLKRDKFAIVEIQGSKFEVTDFFAEYRSGMITKKSLILQSWGNNTTIPLKDIEIAYINGMQVYPKKETFEEQIKNLQQVKQELELQLLSLSNKINRSKK